MSDDSALIWIRPQRPARGPAPSYSRAEIIATAIRIADAQGLDGLTMRKLATELGSGTMSLYRYCPSRDDLLELMGDAIHGEMLTLPFERSDDWRADVRVLAANRRTVLLRHPWAVRLDPTPFGPNTMRFGELWLSTLDRIGLDIDGTMTAFGVVYQYVDGTVRDVGPGPTSPPELLDSLKPYLMQQIATGEFPMLERVIRDAAQPHMDADRQFDYGLGWILDGLPGG